MCHAVTWHEETYRYLNVNDQQWSIASELSTFPSPAQYRYLNDSLVPVRSIWGRTGQRDAPRRKKHLRCGSDAQPPPSAQTKTARVTARAVQSDAFDCTDAVLPPFERDGRFSRSGSLGRSSAAALAFAAAFGRHRPDRPAAIESAGLNVGGRLDLAADVQASGFNRGGTIGPVTSEGGRKGKCS